MPLKGVSDDINAVIDWELSHGNDVSNIPPRQRDDGAVIVLLTRPVRTTYNGAPRELPPSLRPWNWGSQHYEGEELAGFKSDLSGDVVCGPLP